MRVDIKNGKVITSCEHCIFAKWDIVSSVKTQQDCLLNRIKGFRKQNVKIEYKQSDEVSYFVIHTFCNTVRDEEWKEKHGGQYPLLKVLSDVELKIDVIVYDNYNDSYNFYEQLEITVNSILQQKLLPKQVIISISNPLIDYPALIVNVRRLFKNSNIKYYVLKSFNENSLANVDLAFEKVKGLYYCQLPVGEVLDEIFFSKINQALIYDVQKIIAIESFENNVYVFQSEMHKRLEGNKRHPLWRKIHKLAKWQKNERLITNYAKILGIKHV